MRFRAAFTGLIMIVAARGTARGEIHGPTGLPDRLHGLWMISLCVGDTHAWIRYQNLETGEVHTCGRYGRGFGSVKDALSGRQLWPAARHSGVQWDMDMMYDRGVRTDMKVLRSTIVRDPVVFRGSLRGFGHLGIRLNCVTYARDAWYFYTREYYPLPPIASPRALGARAAKGPPPRTLR